MTARRLWRGSASLLLALCLSACLAAPSQPTPYPTFTPYPTSTPYPTPTGLPADEALVQAVYTRIDEDEQMPAVGKEAVMSLFFQRPTFAFRENKGLVVQFSIPRYPTPLEAKLAAYQLVEAAVKVAREQSVAVEGVEVVYFHQGEPWAALASKPPWGDDALFLVPIADEMIKELTDQGIITPLPSPTATEQPTY